MEEVEVLFQYRNLNQLNTFFLTQAKENVFAYPIVCFVSTVSMLKSQMFWGGLALVVLWYSNTHG